MDDLNDFLKKAVYLGVGLAAYVVEKIEHLDDSLTELQTQVQQTVDELIDKGEQYIAQNDDTDTASSWEALRLRRRLLELLNGNEELATRLVEQTRLQNPDRSIIWSYEKVIRDLERDRL